MRKQFAKIATILFAIAMLITCFSTVAYAAYGEIEIVAEPVTVELDGINDATVTVKLAAVNGFSLLGIQGYWSTGEVEGTNYLSLTDIGSDGLTFNGTTNAYEVSSGYVVWADDTWTGATIAQGASVLTATYKVAADTPAGKYTVTFATEFGMDMNSVDFYDVFTATIEIKEAAPACDHVGKNYTYEPNNNGTHKVKCECGEYKTESEACSGTSTECEGTDTCSKCGDEFNLAHNITYVPEVIPANCQQTGHDEYWECDKCGALFGDAECSYQLNPAWVNYTGDHVRPEGVAVCAVVQCVLCGEDSYGEACDRGEAPVCQDATCVNCGETVWGWGCNYNTGDEETPLPLCQPGDCVYCGTHYEKLYDCENGAWANCLDGECSYGCGKQYPATIPHDVEDPCEGGMCAACWNNIDGLGHESDADAPCQAGSCIRCSEPVAATENHEYFYACDTHCMNCGEKTNPTATHSITHVEAKPGTDCQTYDGHMEYWTCSHCGGVWTDENLMHQTSMMSIKVNGEHKYEYDCSKNCKVCEELTRPEANHEYFYPCDPVCCICYEVTNPEATHSIIHVEAKPGTDCQTYDGNIEYWYCEHCGAVWTDEECINITNMMNVKANGNHTYTYDCDTYCKVCEELTRPEAKHEGGEATCTEKAVCQYCETAYGEPAGHSNPYFDYLPWENDQHRKITKCGVCHQKIGDNGSEDHTYTLDTDCVCGAKFTGWSDKKFYKDGVALTGWVAIGDYWYYFDTTTAIRVEGVTRVPYPELPINDVTYAPNQEDIDYATNKGTTFKDANEAWFIFDEDGKFQSDVNGKIEGPYATCYAVDGMIPWHYGLVKITNKYYYFVGDTVNGGNKVADGPVWITRANGVEGLDNGACYYFLGGVLANNLTEIVDGKYYENGKLIIGAGLVKIEEGKYIYVRSSGQVVINAQYYIPANDLGIVSTLYTFDENGYMVEPKFTNVNGIVGGYYYENGKIAYGKGVVELKDENDKTYYIYVRSNGQLATGEYWPTKTNDYLERGCYNWGTDGKYYPEEKLNGIVEVEVEGETVYYYYIDGKIAYGEGVVQLDDGAYIYVRSNGQLATGKYWPTTRNGFLERGEYDWGKDGKYYPAK